MHLLQRLSAVFRRRSTPPVYVDIAETGRRGEIAEASYQQWADSQSKVLRVSGRAGRGAEGRQIPGVVVRVKGKKAGWSR